MHRRTALGAGLALTATLAGCSISQRPPAPRQEPLTCVDRDGLTTIDHVGAAETVYEVNESPTAFPIEAGFLGQVEKWQDDWLATSGLPTHDQLWSYGAWVRDGRGCDSWHGAGRALDISRLRSPGGPIVSCREDLWAGLADVTLREDHRRRYWSLAASLHLHFAYVLTYLYDRLHRNHIHIDNSVSRAGMSVFDRGSRVQIQMVQSACRWLWDVAVEPTDVWDRQTRNASHAVLEQLGSHGDVSRGDNWDIFLRGSVPRAAQLIGD